MTEEPERTPPHQKLVGRSKRTFTHSPYAYGPGTIRQLYCGAISGGWVRRLFPVPDCYFQHQWVIDFHAAMSGSSEPCMAFLRTVWRTLPFLSNPYQVCVVRFHTDRGA